MTALAGRQLLMAAGVTVVLTGASLAAVAATQPGSRGSTGPGVLRPVSSCAVPTSLPGSRVTAVLGDMGAGMAGPGMKGQGMARSPVQASGTGELGPMMLHAAPQRVGAGTVTILAFNHGSRTHELVVLPLTTDAAPGGRPVGSDGTVSETGSLGEASRSCGSGAGDGIAPGAAGWVTLTLQLGRYELVCNVPGHYAAGMVAELDVA